MNGVRHHSAFLPLMGLLIALAWFTLWVWEQSPYGRYLDHGDWTQIGVAANICLALPAGEVVLPILLYVGGWILMIAAMMLPTTLPLLEIFRRLTIRRRDRGQLIALVIVGYLAAWTIFGLAAHGIDWGLRELVEGNVWLTFNGWVFGAAVLALGGAFQFTSLKYRCLDKCRSPMMFVMQHWRGKQERLQAFLLGVAHGLFCVGCCWALMLLMFVVGTGNVGWMLALGVVMALEKNLPWGRHLSTPLGLGLLLWAVVVIVDNSRSLLS